MYWNMQHVIEFQKNVDAIVMPYRIHRQVCTKSGPTITCNTFNPGTRITEDICGMVCLFMISHGLKFIDLPKEKKSVTLGDRQEKAMRLDITSIYNNARRQDDTQEKKDANMKIKISTLVQQSLHDTDKKIESVKQLREQYKTQAPYRIGFILNSVKKSRDIMNELFNVAVKHRDEWKSLEQLKIFEIIVHSNVDTLNYVRQLVDIHERNLADVNKPPGDKTRRL